MVALMFVPAGLRITVQRGIAADRLYHRHDHSGPLPPLPSLPPLSPASSPDASLMPPIYTTAAVGPDPPQHPSAQPSAQRAASLPPQASPSALAVWARCGHFPVGTVPPIPSPSPEIAKDTAPTAAE